MPASDALPPEFILELDELEKAYLKHSDPILQSGFGGGPDRWRAERSPILEGVDRDGTILDVGCANGYLLECLVKWAAERGRSLTPFGLDHGSQLIDLARARFPAQQSHFYVGNAWNWQPPRRFTFVYALWDLVPTDRFLELVQKLLGNVVEAGGRLIIGAYGSRSRRTLPLDVLPLLSPAGLVPIGQADGGDPPITHFVWFDAPRRA